MPPRLSLVVPERSLSASVRSPSDTVSVRSPSDTVSVEDVELYDQESTPSFTIPVTIKSISNITSKTGIPYDDLILLLEKLNFNEFFIKYPISLFYDETDKFFIEKNPHKQQELNGWIRKDFEEFIQTIREETIVEKTLPNGQKLINPTISGPAVQFHTEGLTFDNIKYILHHTKEASISIPKIPEIDHVVYLLYDYISTLTIKNINKLIDDVQSFREMIIKQLQGKNPVEENKKPIVDLVIKILESIKNKNNIYQLLTNIQNNQTIYRKDLINGLTTDKLINEVQLILKIPNDNGFYSVKQNDIYNTIINVIESQKNILTKYQFILVDSNPETFLVEALFKKPLLDGIPFLKKPLFLANISLLFENLSTNDLTIYRCKIKTTYSDIIDISYTNNPDKITDPVQIKIKIIKNPISLDVYQNYPQIIQTYYCFYLLNNPYFINQICQLLQPKKEKQRATFRKQRNTKSILDNDQVNGSGLVDKLRNVQALDQKFRMEEQQMKEQQMKELSIHFTTMMNHLQEQKNKHFDLFLAEYLNKIGTERGQLYCINETSKCIENRFISGGKKKVSKHKKTLNKHERS